MSTTKGTLFANKQTLNIKGSIVDLSSPKVMGILNLTPDSFVAGSRYSQVDELLKAAEKMLKDGAHFLDIGAYSSRPGAQDISGEEEWNRLKKFIMPLRAEFKTAFISCDTFRADVAQKVLDQGIDIINDITAGRDPQMSTVLKEYKCPYIMMHMQGTPQTMQVDPSYSDVVLEIGKFLSDRLIKLKKIGIADVIVDVGFGFGKTMEQNYRLLHNLEHFDFLGAPILVGVSRKSMITKVLNISSSEALNGTSVLNTLALERGAKILRVHEVREAMQAVQLFQALKGESLS